MRSPPSKLMSDPLRVRRAAPHALPPPTRPPHLAVDAFAVADENVPRARLLRQVPEALRLVEPQERMDAERARPGRGSTRVVPSASVQTSTRSARPPERGLVPARGVEKPVRLRTASPAAARRARGDAGRRALGEERAVAVVAVDQLDDAGGLPERAHVRVDPGSVDGVDEPHPAVRPAAHERPARAGLGCSAIQPKPNSVSSQILIFTSSIPGASFICLRAGKRVNE